MLQFITGRAGSGKTRYIRNMLVEAAGRGNGEAMLLVPEQYSFESERSILEEGGAVNANNVRILSFTRLADMVFRKYGGISGKRLSDGGRRVIMELAVEAARDHLEVYESSAKDGRLAELMLTMVNELKMCGIDSKMLTDTSGILGGSGISAGLSKKLLEIALIYQIYEALVEQSYLDSRDDLTRLYEVLDEQTFFEGYDVFVDAFDGYTMQEMKVLERILSQAENVYISICTDNLPEEGTGLFAMCNRTKNRIKKLARQNNIAIRPDVVLEDGKRFKNPNLALLERNLFDLQEETSADSHGIELFCAKDSYEEAEYVAATITDLVMHEGYRYQDITVVCRDGVSYSKCLDISFRKRDIPCFISMPMKVNSEPLMRFVLSGLEAAVYGASTEIIFSMVKTGLSGIAVGDLADLENYAIMWGLKSEDWNRDFDRHPRGFGRELKEEDLQSLARLNEIRLRVIRPINIFRKKLSGESISGEDISKGIYELLMDYDMEENIKEYCRSLDGDGELQLAEKQIRVWELLMSILDQLASILEGRQISPRRYEALLQEVINGEDISEIPQVVDSVLFGTPEQVRQSSPKAVFVMGACQDKFPAVPKASGMFSDIERRRLIEYLPFTDSIRGKVIEERYLAYSVLSLASERLYVSYPKSMDGEDMQAGEIVGNIHSVFEGIKEQSDLPAEFFANSADAAFSVMAAKYRENSKESSALKKLFEELPEYEGRLRALQRAADGQDEHLTVLPKAFEKGEIFLSPTQIESFYSCRFKYFCKYVLNASERTTAKLDAMQYGTVMHRLFELLFSDEHRKIEDMPQDELEAEIEKSIEDYAQVSLGGLDRLSSREKYRLERMGKSAALLTRHVSDELAQSKFKPKHLELRLGYGKDFPILRVRGKSGMIASVGGTIDRVDSFDAGNGDRFVRVVDYKTGNKSFDLADVLYGLNMQMLIYLAALVESGELLPAGVFYNPLAQVDVKVEPGDSLEKIKDNADKKLKMNGIVLKDSDIIEAMEAQAAGRYIPASINSKGEIKSAKSALDSEEFSLVLDYSKALVAAMADSLAAGDVSAKPAARGKLACTYCSYSTVCGSEYDEEDVDKAALNNNEVLEAMRQELLAEGGDENG